MEPTDITIEILRSIRDEITGVRDEVRGTNGRLDGVNVELRGVKSELQDVKAVLGVHGQAIVKLIHEVHGLNERFDNFLLGAHHEDHADLRARVGRLEAKVG